MGFANMPKCRVCRRPASRGKDLCFRHAGTPLVNTDPRKRANRVLSLLERENLIPVDLARLSTWQLLRKANIHGALKAKKLLERFCERDVDPNGWISALRDADG